MHDDNCFLTLTYSDDALSGKDYSSTKKPLVAGAAAAGSISVRDLQLFFKRFRKHLDDLRKPEREKWLETRPLGTMDDARKKFPALKIRYYAAGEYGDETSRPHYHAILFGFSFPDAMAWRKTARGHQIYRSSTLESLWPFGHCEFGSVTRASGGYVARYVMKKITGAPASEHYLRRHPVTDVEHLVSPEFALMSRKPGLGAAWFDTYAGDAFPSDYLVFDGTKVPVPQYFLKKLDADSHNLYTGTSSFGTEVLPSEHVKRGRRVAARSPQNQWNTSPERLAVREEVAQRRLERLKRELE